MNFPRDKNTTYIESSQVWMSAIIGDAKRSSNLVLFKALTGADLRGHLDLFVPKYDKGGMSSGRIDSDFWLRRGIPLLLARLEEANQLHSGR